jgi:hypothetical protein
MFSTEHSDIYAPIAHAARNAGQSQVRYQKSLLSKKIRFLDEFSRFY